MLPGSATDDRASVSGPARLFAGPLVAWRTALVRLGPAGATRNARLALDERRRAELETEQALRHVTGRPPGGTAEPRGA